MYLKEKLHKQCQDALNQRLGSLVKTTVSNYFIGVSVGEITIENETFYAISLSTPIGQLLVSKGVGDDIQFRMQKFTITDIL